MFKHGLVPVRRIGVGMSARGLRWRRAGFRVAVAAALATIAPLQAQAQFHTRTDENRPWQFLNPSERSVRAGQLDLMLRYQRGFYRAPIYNIDNTTNVAGDQYNCTVSATTSANSAFASTSGSSGAPTVLNAPTVDATTNGNAADLALGTPLSGSASASNSQTVGGSTLSSNANPSIGGVSGTIAGSTNSLSQATSNAQSVLNSPLTATVTGSNACQTTNTTVSRR